PQPAFPEGAVLVPGRGDNGLPRPVQCLQPGVPGLAWGDAQPRLAQARAGPARTSARGRASVRERWAEPQDAPAISIRDERRRAPAGRLRPGPGGAAEADPGRRAGIDARRLDPRR